MSIQIIAEIAQAHDGSLGRAHSFIDAAADCKVDAVKFQTHIAQFESSREERWRIKFSYEDETRYDYWHRMEFSRDQWSGLIRHCHQKNIDFIGTPFSVEAYTMLKELGVKRWKVASGEITNSILLEKMANPYEDVILSTGMSSWREIDRAVNLFQKQKTRLSVLQCTSLYPTPPDKIGLNIIDELKTRYGVTVGFSDHSGNVFTGIAAAMSGAEIIEAHLCMSKYDFGPDTSSSLDVEEFRQMVDGVRFVEKINQNPVDKDNMAESLLPMHALFTKTIYAKSDIQRGTVIQKNQLGARKAANGLSVSMLDNVVGCVANKTIYAGNTIFEDDIIMCK